jgi:SAM-dependent methyltransferase
VFEDRARAESFGELAVLYERARPRYPAALFDALLGDGAGLRVLDVGCGTGIAAALLAERGCEVLGVEVDARMAAVARAKGLDVEVARFESWCDRGRRFDLVTAAQAWHWVEPQAGVEKAASVLDAGGRIGLFWNFSEPPAKLRGLLAPLYERLAPELENQGHRSERRRRRVEETVAALAASGRFGPVSVETFAWERTYVTAEWVEQLSTQSDHHALQADRRERLLAAVGEAIDSLGGSLEMPFQTALVSARLGG